MVSSSAQKIKNSGHPSRLQPRFKPLPLPFYISRVSAGFPSPADDYLDAPLDLNLKLIQHPASTFFARASGDSMVGAGIHDNALLIVDCSLVPRNGSIVLIDINGEITIKRFCQEGKTIILKAENPLYSSIILNEHIECLIRGVVTSVIHQF